MEHHPSLLAKLLTELLGLARHSYGSFAYGMPLSILERYDHVLNATVAFFIALLVLGLAGRRLNKVPSGFQQMLEGYSSTMRELVADNIQHHPDRYYPLIATLGVFIFLNNFMGTIPGLGGATANWNVTLACALVVFLYYNFHGIKEQGLKGYLGHFAGPVWWLSPLIFPIEILGLGARLLSHSLRLFANMVGEHMVSAVIFGMIPLLLPLPFMVLGMISVVVQTFVFVMLATIYVSGAVAHEH